MEPFRTTSPDKMINMVPESTRVFHLIKGMGRGGAEMLLVEGLRFSDQEQFEYGYGYCLPWKDAMVAGLLDQGKSVTCFNCGGSAAILLAARRIARHLTSWRADLLHCHLPLAGVVGRIAGRLSGVPVIYTEHNRMERYHPLTRRANVMTWRWQERVIAVSSVVSESIRRHAGVRIPVEVVPNGIDADRFDRRLFERGHISRELGIPEDAQVAGTVAVFGAPKALDDWLHAAQILHRQYPQLHFIVVGDGPLRTELERLSISLGLGDSVHFVGLKEDVRPYLALMDVFIMTSLFEGLPLALLEALAMECAVVATSVGGIPEVIRHGENGFLVKPREPEAVAHFASELLSKPEARSRFGIASRETVRTRFSLERMTKDLEAIYTDVLGRVRGER